MTEHTQPRIDGMVHAFLAYIPHAFHLFHHPSERFVADIGAVWQYIGTKKIHTSADVEHLRLTHVQVKMQAVFQEVTNLGNNRQ